MWYLLSKDRLYKQGSMPSLSSVLLGQANADEIVDPVYAKRPIVRVRAFGDVVRLCETAIREDLWSDTRAYKTWYTDYYYHRANAIGQYRTAYIPKRHGGKRELEIPGDALKKVQKQGVRMLQKTVNGEAHSAAYGFVKGRSVVDAMRRHQYNRSRWFLKLDVKDFFGNTDIDTAAAQLVKLFPFCSVREETMRSWLCPYFYDPGNGRKPYAPQGAPSSPGITNLVMVPFDHMLTERLRPRGYVYTRYADDILISHKDKFKWEEIKRIVEETFADAGLPYVLNPSKTRFGSSSGRNWNLGLMLNGHNDLTIGWRNKKNLKAALANLTLCCETDENVNGLIAWYRMTEPEFVYELLDRYSKKFGVDLWKRTRVKRPGTEDIHSF